MPPPAVVTLLTDFGTDDTYVAQMKGAMLALAPGLRFVDITHAVAPQDVAEGAWLLGTAYAAFPPDTVHLCVVDPGVGTARRPIAAAADGRYFVAPDNGLLSRPLQRAAAPPEVVVLDRPALFRQPVSATFHGRDIFAPVAARLATGARLVDVGSPIDDPVLLALPSVDRSDGVVRGRVVHVDRFGNLVTDIEEELLSDAFGDLADAAVRLGSRRIEGISRTYGDAGPGDALALIESSGCLEVAVRDGSATALLRASRGDAVVVERRRR